MKMWRVSWKKWCSRYSAYCLNIVHWKNHLSISIPKQITEVLIKASLVKNMSTWHNAIVSYMSEGLFIQVWAQMLRFAKELMSTQ